MELRSWSEQGRAEVDAFLAPRFREVWPPSFADPLRYPVFGGGKRIRPLLTLAASDALGGDRARAIVPACAVELVHTYSLVHDDLPCMDDDEERRGRPTVHVAFGEDTAVLVGDALLTEAFGLLAQPDVPAEIVVAWVRELAGASGHRGMIGGQVGDVRFGEDGSGVEAVRRVHALKTGALIRAAVMLGAYSAEAAAPQLDALSTYGAQVGLAFQLADDLLDEEEDAEEGGPPSFVKLLGAEETRRRALACADEAVALVGGLPSPEALIALARFAVERTV